jgi:hypothetical protein
VAIVFHIDLDGNCASITLVLAPIVSRCIDSQDGTETYAILYFVQQFYRYLGLEIFLVLLLKVHDAPICSAFLFPFDQAVSSRSSFIRSLGISNVVADSYIMIYDGQIVRCLSFLRIVSKPAGTLNCKLPG